MKTALDIIKEILIATNTQALWSNGELRLLPVGERSYCDAHKAWRMSNRKTPPPCGPCAESDAGRRRAGEYEQHAAATREAANLRIIRAHALPEEDCPHEWTRQTGGHMDDCVACLEASVVEADPAIVALQEKVRQLETENAELKEQLSRKRRNRRKL